MEIRKYRITITGVQPLLMHADDIDWSDKMEEWKLDKDNKKSSKAGDDRSPAWRWIGNLYNDGQNVIIPTANVMRCLMEGGAMVLVPGGKMGKTFKAQTQSGIVPAGLGWPLLLDNKPVAFKPFKALVGKKDFAVHKQAALDNGFELFLKRAKIGASKHVRVRPRFEKWGTVGDLHVADEQITGGILADILEAAGFYKGLGDWRPGGKTPGSFGMFESGVQEL